LCCGIRSSRRRYCAVKLEAVGEDASGPAAPVTIFSNRFSISSRKVKGGSGGLMIMVTNARWCLVCLRIKVVSKDLPLYFAASDNSQIIIQFFLPSQPLVQIIIKTVIFNFQKLPLIYRNCRFEGRLQFVADYVETVLSNLRPPFLQENIIGLSVETHTHNTIKST
jgi:hypothetical protein